MPCFWGSTSCAGIFIIRSSYRFSFHLPTTVTTYSHCSTFIIIPNVRWCTKFMRYCITYVTTLCRLLHSKRRIFKSCNVMPLFRNGTSWHNVSNVRSRYCFSFFVVTVITITRSCCRTSIIFPTVFRSIITMP